MNIGETITHLRKSKGILQKDLAEQCGISATYLSGIEKGNRTPPIPMIKTICEKLEVEWAFLVFLALEETDVKPEKAENFNLIAPIMKGLINQLI